MVDSSRALVINAANLTRIDDRWDNSGSDSTTSPDGLGDRNAGPANMLVGYFLNDNVEDMHSIWVFQMTGAAAGADILNAGFSVTQGGTGTLPVDAYVVRTSSDPAILLSDYETNDQLLMAGFHAGGSGLKTLDAGGQAALTAYLQANWVENDYVFIGLKNSPYPTGLAFANGDPNNYVYYSNGLADAQLTLVLVDDYAEELATVANLGNLTNAPVMRADDTTMTTTNVSPGEMKAIYFDALDYNGSPTRVYAYLGIPAGASSNSPVPGIVLVHGGGGTAFDDWVQLWLNRGYAAISIAVEGQTDSTAPPTINTGWHIHNMPGPVRVGIYGDSGVTLTNQWMYHAVADTVLANSLMRSLPEVDADRVGLMGISWGGVITSTAIGIDTRFRFAVPTYGCGNKDIAENIYGDNLGNNDLYKFVWDPMARIANATMPVLWFSWPQEWHFPLYCQRDTYTAAPGIRMVSLVPGMGHGHQPAWNRPESYAYADSIVMDGSPWCVQQGLNLSNGIAEVTFQSSKILNSATLVSTMDTGLTGDRTWTESVAALTDNGGGSYSVTAALPNEYITAWFVNVQGGTLISSSDFQEIDGVSAPSNVIFNVSTNWSSKSVKVNDTVVITNGAAVTFDEDSSAISLTVADGVLQMDQNYTLSLVNGVSIDSAGAIHLNDGRISTTANQAAVDGTLVIDGGSFSFSTAGQGYTVSGGGTVKVQGGTFALTGGAATDVSKLNTDLEVSGGIVDLDGQIYVGNNVATEFKVIGSDAVIDVERLNQGPGGNSGTFTFVFDETGVSPIQVSAWMSLNNLAIDVDGSAYRGNAASMPLLDAVNLAQLGNTNNFAAAHFGAQGLDAAVVQDQTDGRDWVQLVLTDNEYGAWASANGLSGAGRHMSADPNGNGRDNLMEYATGDGFPFFRPDASSTNLMEIVYHRLIGSDLLYMLEASSNLTAAVWGTDDVTETGIGWIDADYEAVTNTVPADASGFARLTVESP
jgi:dienelactone hydrolase